jgi:hypothetical protein
MEKKIIKITVTPRRYKVSVETYSVDPYTKQERVTTSPGIDGLRTPRNDSALASLVDSYAKLPNYIIKVSRDGETFRSVNDLRGRGDDETVKVRFLQWIPKRIAS